MSDTLVGALLTIHDAAHSIDQLSIRLGAEIGAAARITPVVDQDWERVWLADWKSMRFGRRLWVCPTSAEAPDDPAAVLVRLDPGLAFGTGTHPTTALCLQILDSLPLAGRRVIDYGCGSGILGIAALKLGAVHVTAVDLDPQALLATRDNAIRNGVSDGSDRARRGRGGAVAGVRCGRPIACSPTFLPAVDRIGADPDAGLRARRILGPVGPVENAGLRGKGRVRRRI